jgi:hypothetical protein
LSAVFSLKGVEERTPLSVFRNKIDIAIELGHDHLAHNQTQADTVGIYLSRVFEGTK